MLRDELNNGENQRNPVKYKQLIQQVIFYMTKGIDMTPLFMTIVKVNITKRYLILSKLGTLQYFKWELFVKYIKYVHQR